MRNIYIYIFAAALTSFFIRVLPMTILKKPIKNNFIRSFLYYVPYVTLAVMTFPAIIESTQSRISGVIALACGTIAAWLGFSLFKVAVVCCTVVFFSEFILVR